MRFSDLICRDESIAFSPEDRGTSVCGFNPIARYEVIELRPMPER
jgi:hypothetical protein